MSPSHRASLATAFLALIPALLLAALLGGTIADPGWLSWDTVEGPEPRSSSRALEPRHREWLRRDPPQGVALGLYHLDHSFDYTEMLQEIASTGARWVEFCVSYYQDRHDSSTVARPDPRTPPWRQIEKTARTAHRLGLRVHLMPILLLREARPQDWRGTIRPIERDRWYRSYRDWMRTIARSAEECGIEAICVGSELNSMQQDRDEWLRTIGAVREVYGGAVTYSANWDSYTTVPFLEALDAIGLTTYYPLSDRADPAVEELVASWLPVRAELRAWQRSHGVPMIFTEVGYPSIDGAAQHPWDYTAEGEIDLAEQRDCYLAFAQAWKGIPELAGVFFYNWYDIGGPTDRGYTPRMKPALEVVERWFRTLPAREVR